MISQKATLHNRFDFEIYDTKTGETEYAQAENIVLNNMWTRLCSGSVYFNYIGVGTGTGTLSATRTGLFSHLEYKLGVAVETVYDTDTTAHITKSATFSEIEAIGTWTEVGIRYGSSTSSYVTHALITDSEGNPITISKTNTKIVTIYATVFAELLNPVDGYISAVGSKNAVLSTLLDPSNEFIFRLSTLLKPNGEPALLGVIVDVGAVGNADAANKRKYTSLTRLNATTGNGAIRGIFCGTIYLLKHYGAISLPTPTFPGHSFTGVAIGSSDGAEDEFDFPLSFIKSGSETIYVNGVAKTRGTDYTVRYGMRSADTVLVDTSLASGDKRVESPFEEIAVIPQPVGEEVDITAIEMKNGSSSGSRITSYDIKLSMDGINWVDAGSSTSWVTSSVVTLNAFTPAKYKYIKAAFAGGVYIGYLKIHATPPSTKQINFIVPPPAGAAITADFSVEYIPKSENFVLDVQAEILFGEGA